MIDKYEVIKHLNNLNIPQDVDFTLKDINSAYRLMANYYHPDKNKTLNTNKKMTTINNSYEYIKKHFDEIKELNLINDNSSSTNIDDQFKYGDNRINKNQNINLGKMKKIFIIIITAIVSTMILLSFILAMIAGNA